MEEGARALQSHILGKCGLWSARPYRLRVSRANHYTTLHHEKYRKAWNFRGMIFRGFQIFTISLHIIFAELTIYYMGYLTAVKFRCMLFSQIFQNREYRENYMHAKMSCFAVLYR